MQSSSFAYTYPRRVWMLTGEDRDLMLPIGSLSERYQQSLVSGDVVFLWRPGKSLELYGWGLLHLEEASGKQVAALNVGQIEVFEKSILYEELVAVPELRRSVSMLEESEGEFFPLPSTVIEPLFSFIRSLGLEPPPLLPLSPSSIDALSAALGMQLARHAIKIHMEDLLFGLLGKPQGPTQRAFQAVGLTERELQEALARDLDLVMPEPKYAEFEGFPPPLSKHTRQALDHAESVAWEREDDRIRTRDLLAGFWSVQECKIRQVVHDLVPEFGEHVPGWKSPDGREESSDQLLPDDEGEEDFGVRVQPLANDVPQGPDLLDIEHEVQALAEAIALVDMRPPLVVGVLGGWGTGKSFVLHLLEEHLGRIRCEDLKPGEEGGDPSTEKFPYVGHPYVIRFDAWTYAKADLWASLMQTIFLELNRQIGLEQRLKDDLNIDLQEGTAVWRLLSRLTPSQLEELRQEELGHEAIERLHRLERDALEAEDLWASLEGLKREEQEALAASEEELAKARKELEAANLALESEVEEALARKAQQQAFEPLRAELKSLVGGAWKAAWDERPPEFETVEQEALAWNRLRRGWSGGATVLVVFALVALLTGLMPWVEGQAGQLGQKILGLGSGFAALVGAYLEALRGVRQKLEKWQDAYRRGIESFREQQDELRDRLREERLQEQMALLAVAPGAGTDEEPLVPALEKKVRALEAEVDGHRRNVGLTARHPSLLDFLRGRLESGFYDERLGILHQAQRDLADLTAALLDHPTDSVEQKARRRELFPRGEPRVVLMIDDLDRCPPTRVVEVLEAAQLLVKTRLFVVVLAMDVRYITRALEKVYAGVLTRDGEPSGLDYIEKIVQIPYRVRPIHDDALAGFLAQQMVISERVEAETEDGLGEEPDDFSSGYLSTVQQDTLAPEPSPSAKGPPLSAEALDLSPPSAPAPSAEPTAGSTPSESVSQRRPWLRGVLPTRIVEFQPEEFDLLESALRQVDLSPRASRRLVNVCKLMKIVWFRRGMGAGPALEIKEAMFGLLVTAAHHPEVMRELLVDLERASWEDHSQTLLGFLNERCESGCLSVPEGFRQAAKQTLARVLPKTLQLRQLEREQLVLVSSFSFVGEGEPWAEPC